jgi:DNA-binding NarL/FixJ family response regulator
MQSDENVKSNLFFWKFLKFSADIDFMKQIKIVIITPSELLRAALKTLFEAKTHFKVSGEPADFNPQILLSEENEPPHIILLDESAKETIINFPFLTKLIRKTKIVVLTDSQNAETNRKYLELSFRGAVYKDEKFAVLAKAVKTVHEGGFWFERGVLEEVLNRLFEERLSFYENPEMIRIASLTDREKELLILVVEGLKNKEIAQQLYLSEHTVRHHLGSIFEKLNVTSKQELIVFAFKNNLVLSKSF